MPNNQSPQALFQFFNGVAPFQLLIENMYQKLVALDPCAQRSRHQSDNQGNEVSYTAVAVCQGVLRPFGINPAGWRKNSSADIDRTAEHGAHQKPAQRERLQPTQSPWL